MKIDDQRVTQEILMFSELVTGCMYYCDGKYLLKTNSNFLVDIENGLLLEIIPYQGYSFKLIKDARVVIK